MKKAQLQHPWLADLNPEQRAAVVHGDGPLLVVAGAGSGKTRTLAYRVAYLIATGVPAERILLLTFTRRAAQEMGRRAAAIIASGTATAGRLWSGTFHATSNRLLRMYAESAGLSPDFTVLDQGDAADLMNIVRNDLQLASAKNRFPRKGTCLSIYSRCMGGADDLATVLRDYFPWCEEHHDPLKQLFGAYVDRKLDQMVLDYDDLLIYLEQILTDDHLAEDIGSRFDHVLVDEYQDTNPVQARILQGLRRTNPNITVVGDDAQSIYSFRSATIRNMLDFGEHFPGTQIIKLEQNYRSTIPILTVTNHLIAQSTDRYAKELWSNRDEGEKPHLVMCQDERQQDDYVITTVLKHLEEGIPLNKQAVLFRTSHHADSLEVELTRRRIPYRKFGGLRFLEAAHVKDLVCFLRIVENPRDELAWFRILLLLKGVGPKTAQAAKDHVQTANWDANALATFKAPPASKKAFRELAQLLGNLQLGRQQPPATQLEQIRHVYDPILKHAYENPEVRLRDLEHLEQIAENFQTREQFLTELVLDPPTSTADLPGPACLDEDWLNLSTIHSSKGCEWDVVVLIHAADGCIPSDLATGKPEQLDEERRLAYVAMTRARDNLYVTWPMRYYHRKHRHGDAHTYVQLCRFLDTPTIKPCFTRTSLSPGGAHRPARQSPVKRDIGQMLRNRWNT